MSFKQYTCNLVGHEGKEIIGMCQNVNCTQPSRRVCFACSKIHSKNDPQFELSDIVDEEQLEILINERRSNLTSKVNETQLHCDIQNYFLQLEMIQFIYQWSYKQSKLQEINNNIDKFRNECLETVSIENYINHNIGLNEYTKIIEQKLVDININKNIYLISMANKQINQEKIQEVEQQAIQKDLQDTLSYRNKMKEKSLDYIFENFKPNDDHYVTLCESLLKQRYDLKNNNLYEQYQLLRSTVLKSQLEEYQLLYLDAYELLYSQDKDQTVDQQLKLINKSLQANQNYEKSIELKKIIQNQIVNENSDLMAVGYHNKAIELFNLNNFQEAINSLDQAIKMNPDLQQAYYIKGICYQRIQKHYEAVDAFNQAIAKDPKDEQSFFKKAISLDNLNRYVEALDTIQQVEQLNPNNVGMLKLKASILQHLERYEDALIVLDQAIQQESNNQILYNNKGVLLNQLKRFEEANEMFDKAIEIDHLQWTFFRNKGLALFNSQKYQESLDSIDKAILLNPKDEYLHKLKQRALINLGRDEEANDILKKFYEDNPQNDDQKQQ